MRLVRKTMVPAMALLGLLLLAAPPALAASAYEGAYAGQVTSQAGTNDLTFTVAADGSISDLYVSFSPNITGTGAVDAAGNIAMDFDKPGAFEFDFTGTIDAQLAASGTMTGQVYAGPTAGNYNGPWTAQGTAPPAFITLTGASISASLDGWVNTAYDMLAAPEPSDAQGALAYLWSPEPDAGQGTNRATYTFVSAGEHTVSCAITQTRDDASFTADHTITIRDGAPTAYWPATAPDYTWQTKDPAELGYDAALIDQAVDYAFNSGHGGPDNTVGFLVVVDGYIIAEKYASELGAPYAQYNQDFQKTVASASKPMLTSLVGMAQERGLIEFSDPVSDYVTGFGRLVGSGDTVMHHMTMTSGLYFDAAGAPYFVYRPGEYWKYDTEAKDFLWMVLDSFLGASRDIAATDVFELAKEWLYAPLGMSSAYVIPRKGNAITPTNPTTAGSMSMTARDMARFGLMSIREGEWNGRQVVTPAWLAAATNSSSQLNQAYGYMYWLNGKDQLVGSNSTIPLHPYIYPHGPEDAYGAHGSGVEIIQMIPSLNMVVVRKGWAPSWEADSMEARFPDQWLDLIMAAAPGTHAITAAPDAGGTILPEGATHVVDGLDHLFTIIPAAGYAIADVLVDGVSVGAVTSYKFTNVTADHTISATFTATNPTPPVVVRTIPGDGAVNRAVDTWLSVQFDSIEMDKTTLERAGGADGTFTLAAAATRANVEASVTYDAARNAFQLQPLAPLAYGTLYTATVSTDAADLAGTHLAAPFTFSFTTGGDPADATPPAAQSTSPADGATGVDRGSPITITFSENVDPVYINAENITLASQARALVAGAVSYDAATRTATFTPAADLLNGTTYTLSVSENVRDISGNPLSAAYDLTFTTKEAPPSWGLDCFIGRLAR